MKGLGHGNGVRVRRDDVAGLAAADHGEQERRNRDVRPAADRERDGRDGDDGDVHEHADGRHDQRRERHGGEGEARAAAGDDRVGDLRRAPGLHERAHEHAGDENAQHRGHHRLRPGDHRGDRRGETAAAEQPAGERSEDERVRGRRPPHDQHDRDGQPRQRAPGGEHGLRHGASFWPPRRRRSTISAIAPSPVKLHAVPMPSRAM